MGLLLSSGFRAAIFLSCFLDRFLCSTWNPVSSPRPAVLQSRRAQELSRLAVAPTLYGVVVVKRFNSGDLSCFLDRFLCSTWNPVSSPRPAVLQSRRAQELSRLAVAPTFPHTLPLPGHTLTALSTAAHSMRPG